MKNFRRLLSALVAFIAITVLNSAGVNAYWKQDSNNHWNYVVIMVIMLQGGQQIDGHWYYFYSDGYMAHDTLINGYIIDSSGVWCKDLAEQQEQEKAKLSQQ